MKLKKQRFAKIKNWVKTHKKTGIRYLCVTKNDPFKYRGSGIYWNLILDAHGSEHDTEVIFESESMEEISEKGLYYSSLWDVVKSDCWANRIPEAGYDQDASNFRAWWNGLDETTKNEFIEFRNEQISKNHYSKGPNSEAIYKIISEKNRQWFYSLPIEEQQSIVSLATEGGKRFKLTPEWEETKKKIGETVKTNLSGLSQEEKKERMKPALERRANMTPEEKEKYTAKKREGFYRSNYKESFKIMGEARRGGNNPAAKKCVIDGVEYGSMKEASDALGIEYHKIVNIVNKQNR